jgi:MtrB/PioB family decaheme-associated outer membrane protein
MHEPHQELRLKTLHHRPPLRTSVLALHSALALLASLGHASAQSTDPAWTELVQPKRTIELGVAASSRYSAKAFEYSGWTDKGPSAFANIDLRGGGAYDSDDTSRWQVNGTQLGSKAPSLAIEYGVQGRFRLGFKADELLRNQSDSYQTPYLGVGSNRFTLPANWTVPVVPRVNATTPNARGLAPEVTASNALVGGVSTPPTAAQQAAAAALQAADLTAFQHVALFTKRSRDALGGELLLGEGWSLTAGASREHKTGLKAIGAQSRATNGDTSSILPTPLDQHDTQFNLGLAYTGELLQVQAGFESSLFSNNVPSVTWDLWASPKISATAATPPSNQFQKLLFSAQYQAGDATTVVAHAAYSRSTQDEVFLTDSTALLVPQPSAQALVARETAGLKWLHKFGKALSLSAAYQYDLRENKTPVNIYGFYDNNNTPSATPSPFAYLYPGLKGLSDNFNFNANTPYSKRVHQVTLRGDYQVAKGQHVQLALESNKADRYCLGSWINCADATKATEHTVSLSWRGNVADELSARVGLSTARRKVNYDENAFLAVVPMAGQSPATATGALAGTTAYGALTALGLTGYGPVSGLSPAAAAGSAQAFYFPNNNALGNLLYGNENRISELVGMRRFNQSDRNRNKLRSSLNWQATEQVSLQAGFDANSDQHTHSVYGLQRVTSAAVNLEASYAPSDNYNFSLFGSYEQQRSRSAGNSYTANSTATAVNGATAIDGGCFATIALRNASNKIDPCMDWTTTTRDRTTTLGGSASALKLLGSKFDLSASAIYSEGRTAIDASGGNYVNNPFAGIAGAATRTVAAYFVPAAALPLIRARSLDVLLVGTYRIDADQAMRLGYGYQRLGSSDWGYEGLQDGGLTQVLPTREQAPRYEVHRLGVSYVVNF